MTKTRDNPMQSAHDAPRCAAISKRSGLPAKPRSKGLARVPHARRRGGAPEGLAHGRYVHGGYAKEHKMIAKLLAMLR